MEIYVNACAKVSKNHCRHETVTHCLLCLISSADALTLFLFFVCFVRQGKKYFDSVNVKDRKFVIHPFEMGTRQD